MSNPVSADTYDAWLKDNGPAAIVIRQLLKPVTGADGVLFPPTFASDKKDEKPKYNIDEFDKPYKTTDGFEIYNIALIDSVGSQANRVEPAFKAFPLSANDGETRKLVPQIVIQFMGDLKDEQGEVIKGDDKKPKQHVIDEVHLLDAGHRAGDAVVRSSGLADDASDAFIEHREGDATAIAKSFPTSLIFGAWDSRATQHKVPRIVSSTIRAYNVRELRRSAQYNPPKDYVESDLIADHKEDKAKRERYSKEGVLDAPASFTHGGVIADRVVREATLNLATIRDLRAGDSSNADHHKPLQRYILGLALVAITHLDGALLSLRQGCQLVAAGKAKSEVVGADGEADEKLQVPNPQEALAFAQTAATQFDVGADRTEVFDAKILQEDLKKDFDKAWKERKARAEERYRAKQAKKAAERESAGEEAADGEAAS